MPKVTRRQVEEEESRSAARQVASNIAKLESFIVKNPNPYFTGVREYIEKAHLKIRENLIYGVSASDEDAGKGTD
jgi:hypothetical protein